MNKEKDIIEAEVIEEVPIDDSTTESDIHVEDISDIETPQEQKVQRINPQLLQKLLNSRAFGKRGKHSKQSGVKGAFGKSKYNKNVEK